MSTDPIRPERSLLPLRPRAAERRIPRLAPVVVAMTIIGLTGLGACGDATPPSAACDVCQEGTRTCADGAVAQCIREEGCAGWVVEADCQTGATCLDGACIDRCTDACRAGEMRCDGDATQTCTVDAGGCTTWGAAVACEDGAACIDGVCSTACTDACAAGEMRCDGDAAQTCTVGAGGCTTWGAAVACEVGTACIDGVCSTTCTDACAAGATRCAGDAAQTCTLAPTGCTTWGTAVACVDGAACVDGVCVATCTDACALGATACSADGAGTTRCMALPTGCTGWVPVAACAANQVCSDGTCQSAGTRAWQVVPSSTTQTLRDVWGSGPDDVWAVGDGGTLLQYNGVAWTGVNAGTTARLYGVWGSGPDDVWVVSDFAEILHFDGATWTRSQPWPSTVVDSLTDVWGSGPDDVWVVGWNTLSGGVVVGIVGHFDGAEWTLDVSGGPSVPVAVTSVWTASPTQAWLTRGDGVVLRRDAGWLSLGAQDAYRMSGTGPSDIWFARGSNHGIARFDGTSFVSYTTPVATTGHWRGVYARTPTDAWMVGTAGRIIHFGGTTWALDPRVAAVPAVTLGAVWAANAHQAWAVGDGGLIVELRP